LTVDTTADAAPTLTLPTDSGSSTTDGITKNTTVTIGGVQMGSTWEYSTDIGVTWLTGSGTSMALAEGTYAVNQLQVRQKDAAGNVSAVAKNATALTVDTTADAAPSPTLRTDSGSSSSDGITNDGTMTVGSLVTGSTWQYSKDSGVTWIAGSGTSFTLLPIPTL
jgi:hypothetical protein